MSDIRQTFHQQLAEVKTDVARLAAMVTDVIPRGTHVLLNYDLEAAKDLIEHDDELDRLTLQDRGAVLPAPRPPAADGQRPSGDRQRAAHGLGDRAVGRPRRQHRQDHAPHLRRRADAEDPRPHRADERGGGHALQGGHRRLPGRGRRPRRRHRRHGRRARQPAEGLHRGRHRRPRGRAPRPERRRAAGPHRPLLRAHRRPRGQHGRADPVPGHGLAPRARSGGGGRRPREAPARPGRGGASADRAEEG